MNLKTKILIAIALLATAFASGYYLAPTKVKTLVVEKIVEDTTKHKETTKVEVKRPDGTTEITTKTTEDTEKKVNTEVTSSKETTKGGPTVSISALAGIPFTSAIPSLVYGAHVSKNLIGPVSIGAWGLTSGIVGISVGLSF